MKTRNIIIVVVIVLLGIGAWIFLGGKMGGEEGTVSLSEKAEERVESLADIFAKAVGITSFKYDMVATIPGEAVVTTKMWRKGKKMRIEGTQEGQEMIYLVDTDRQLAYMYFPSENTAMKIGLSQAQETVGESPTEQSGAVMGYNPTTVGTEVLDGKTCLVTEHTTETGEVKMWIWTRYGLPIKTETTTAKGISVMELKNIDFSNIPDSMFELPAGVQITEIPSFY